ncbi:non-homologous end-joining DNA ligase [Streptomyces sp. NPDC051940]|uniref:non-homologous end-joining DNA ligase n=1 Tax=Streptomyces sp. NPDC051940 TaxID=3155675 RepID=UPI00342FF82F
MAGRRDETPGRAAELPRIRPMLAVSGALPSPAADAGYGYELKWDGIRAVAYVPGDGSLTLLSRNDNDVTAQYPELAPPPAGLPPCVLDGELVALGPDGRPSFAALQRRMNLTRAEQISRLAAEVPVDYMVFDVLHLDGRSTLRDPYRRRRELLADLALDAPHWAAPPYWEGHGEEALELTRQHHLEGLIAKRLASAYHPDRRSDAWLKIKNVRTEEVWIGGWTQGGGHRRGTFGALLVGLESPRGLVYAGSVGSGFSERALETLQPLLDGLARDTSPFTGPLDDRHVYSRDVHWVEPVLLAEVGYAEWTPAGRLRHPVWRGLRTDKQPLPPDAGDPPDGQRGRAA